MIDLEREVKEVLERQAEEATGRLEERMPDRVRGRLRRRQARTVALSGVAVAVVALGALAGARALSPTAGREPGTGLPTPLFPIGPNPPMTVIASGEFRGLEWNYSAGRDGEIWCVNVEAAIKGHREAMGSCERDPLGPRQMVATSLNTPDFPAVIVSGFVSGAVDRVAFDFDAGGRVEGIVYATPKEMNAPFDVFLILIPKEHPARGLVLAIDARGEVLARHGVYETEFEFFRLEDTDGNVVGSLPPGNPLWHEWIEPGSPATMENIEAIRHAATFPLRKLRPGVRPWWTSRPGPQSSDQAFLDWWAAYPLTE